MPWPRSAARASFGFTGKQCIHPSQLDTVNTAFTPTSEEIARAGLSWPPGRITAEAGYGSTRLAESMIDAPVVRRARHLLAQLGESENL